MYPGARSHKDTRFFNDIPNRPYRQSRDTLPDRICHMDGRST